MQLEWASVIRSVLSEETAFVVSILILVFGLVLAYAVWRWVVELLETSGVSDAVEGTPFERSARRFGTSTIGLVGILAALFVYVLALILALNVARLMNIQLFWSRFTVYIPRLFVAALALIAGMILGDKAKLVISNRLKSVKLPEAGLLPELVKYSIFYIAALVALAQVGVATGALLVLLAAYTFGVVFLSGLALKDLLAASAAGVYLLLVEPYTIGDEIEIDGKRGIVQEIDMFTTHVESESMEYIIPNQHVFRSQVVRYRE